MMADSERHSAAGEEGTCPNCGAVAGEYCPDCGQRQGELAPSLRSWLSRNAEDLVLTERRLPRTLGALLWPPGRLTAEWRRGRRARYLTPLRLYLLLGVPFFLLWTLRAEGTFLGDVVTVVVAETEAAPEFRPMPQPVPMAERDSATIAAWRTEEEARREENRRRRAIVEEQAETARSAMMDFLPLVVGVLLVPVFALLVRFGVGGGHRFVEDLVSALHVHAFAFLLGTAAFAVTALRATPAVWVVAFLLLVVHFGWSLRTSFQLGVFRAVGATVIASGFYALAFLAAYFILLFSVAGTPTAGGS